MAWLRLHPHWVLEMLAYAAGFRVYLWLRRRDGDAIDDVGRWWVIAAAAMGAVAGSKILYWLEDPSLTFAHRSDLASLAGGKTIVGALVGGLFAVEAMKLRLGITRRTGDLFAVPLCVGIAIGRVGCFLTGLNDHTFGVATRLPWGVDFGDGITRHPTQLYESAFAILLGLFLWKRSSNPHIEGDIFRMFMVAYFAFRLGMDFLKPGVRIIFGLSTIQVACLGMLLYYGPNILEWANGRQSARGGCAEAAVNRHRKLVG
jgi:phosphatidylglycerol:prolipoprotein diacylglycerol transferase